MISYSDSDLDCSSLITKSDNDFDSDQCSSSSFKNFWSASEQPTTNKASCSEWDTSRLIYYQILQQFANLRQ